jgi:hypothetical protein
MGMESRLAAVEKILLSEYEEARTALGKFQCNPGSPSEGNFLVDQCIAAMKRLRIFLTDRSIPEDVEQKLSERGCEPVQIEQV